MTTIDGDALLRGLEADGAWLHGLARSLCRDPERAADAAQETLVTALERPPEGGPRRPWLARVLRNRLVQDWRADVRRTAREVRSARPDAVPAGDRTLARLELQARVATAIRDLDEPFRTTVVLRYLDGLPPRRIAAETGVPVQTVKGRLERGLVRLRARFDRDFGGDRTRWMTALLALPRAPWTPGILAGASVMGLGTKVIASGAVVAAVWVGAYGWRGAPGGGDPPADTGVGAAAAEHPQDLVDSGREPLAADGHAGPRERTALDPPPAAPEPDPWRAVVRGRDGAPVAGVPVGVRREDDRGEGWLLPPVTSADDGIVGWSPDEPPAPVRYNPCVLDVAGSGWAPLRRAVLGAERFLPEVQGSDVAAAPAEQAVPALVVAPARPLELLVVDDVGVPLAGVTVEVELSPVLRRELEGEDRAGRSPRWRGVTDGEGRLGLPALPAVDGLLLGARSGGYAPREVELDAGFPVERTLVLDRLQAGETVVSGRVLGPDGLPFAGALVSAGGASMESEASGWFAVPVPPEGERFRGWQPVVHAVAPGHLPGSATVEDLEPGAFVELHLGGAPLTIRGRVSGWARPEERAHPLRTAVVWANGIAAFGEVPIEVAGNRRMARYSFVEDLLDPLDAPLGGPSAYVGEDGSFELRGLRDKAYTLYAYDPETLALSEAVLVPAGARGVELALRSAPAPLTVEGRVVDRRGTPVQGAQVSFSRPLDVDGYTYPGGVTRTTGANGSFSFPSLHFDELECFVRGAEDSGVADRGFTFTRAEAALGLELVVGSVCRMRVLAEDPLLATARLMVVDAEGNGLSLERVDGNTSMLSGSFELAGGRSGIVLVEDSAHELLLWDAEGRKLSVPLELTPGAIEEVVVR